MERDDGVRNLGFEWQQSNDKRVPAHSLTGRDLIEC